MSIIESPHRLLTFSEAAETARVSESTIRRRVNDGSLKAVQLGGRGKAVRIDADELEVFLYGEPEENQP